MLVVGAFVAAVAGELNVVAGESNVNGEYILTSRLNASRFDLLWPVDIGVEDLRPMWNGDGVLLANCFLRLVEAFIFCVAQQIDLAKRLQ